MSDAALAGRHRRARVRGAPVRAARRRSHDDERHRRRDLRDRLHGAQHSRRQHRARVVRARRVVRPRRLRGSARAAPLVPGLDRLAVALRARVPARRVGADRISGAAPARRLLLAAHARVLGAHLCGRFSLDRVHRRRERTGRRHARGLARRRSRESLGLLRDRRGARPLHRLRAVAVSRFADRHRAARHSRQRAAGAVRRLCDAALQADRLHGLRRRSPGSPACCSRSITASRPPTRRRSRSRASSSRW